MRLNRLSRGRDPMRSADDFRSSSSQSNMPRLLALGAVLAAGALMRRSSSGGGSSADAVDRPTWAHDLAGTRPGERGTRQRIGDLMTRGVHTLEPDDTLVRAAVGMRDAGVGSLPVCRDGAVIGMVTDRDLVVRAMADGADARTVRVSDVMTPDVLVAREDDRLQDVIARMGRRQVRRIPVLDAQDRLVGMLALGDVAVRSDAKTDRVLEQVSEPAPEGDAPRG